MIEFVGYRLPEGAWSRSEEKSATVALRGISISRLLTYFVFLGSNLMPANGILVSALSGKLIRSVHFG